MGYILINGPAGKTHCAMIAYKIDHHKNLFGIVLYLYSCEWPANPYILSYSQKLYQ